MNIISINILRIQKCVSRSRISGTIKLPFAEIPMARREICVQSAFLVFREETRNS